MFESSFAMLNVSSFKFKIPAVNSFFFFKFSLSIIFIDYIQQQYLCLLGKSFICICAVR